MAQEQILAQLKAIGEQLTKAKDEITAALQNAGTITPELQAALDGLANVAQALDDINPDAPVEEPEA